MDRNSIYFRQVQLLIRLLPLLANESCFALKGGTAINLFVRDLPRLSVDIDLVYLPLEARETAIKNAREALTRIAKQIETTIPGSKTLAAYQYSDALRLVVSHQELKIKIELSPVLRGTVFPVITMSVRECVEVEFGYAEMPVLSLPDLYAGKICAALDRQHPRDLFDIKLLLENEGISEEIRKTFLVYLISHGRPILEVLSPRRIDIRQTYEGEFRHMTQIPVTVDELEEAREMLINAIHTGLTREERQFLISFKSRMPEWALLGLKDIDQLPAVKWKMLNLQKMPENKHAQALQALKDFLNP